MTPIKDATVASGNVAAIDGIPGYRAKRLLDRGGMGDVYLAEDENLQRQVAIKVILPDLCNDPEYKKRFTREAVTVAAFHHPNIVTVYASGWLGDKQFIVMEYIGGGTLDRRMESSRLTEEEAAETAGRMADALAYAHEREVIHRDFKPRNVLLRENGTPVLSDFGIAKSQMSQVTEKTQAGVVIGNLRYMAPEQALGHALSDRVDIYSFGLVLYEMLDGDLPESHPVRTKQDERALVKSVGAEFAGLIGQCLHEDPRERPSAMECRDWLEAHVRRPPPRPFWRRMSLVIIAGILVAAGLGLFALRQGILRTHPAAESKPDMMLSIVRLPPSSRIYVDGNLVATPSAHVSAGTHELAAVAAGYYGEVRRISVSGPDPSPASFTLDATALPSLDEEERFLKLADAPSITENQVASVQERTLNTVLRAKLLRQAGQAPELDELGRQVQTLLRLGDTRAAVASVLIDSVQSGQVSSSQVTQPLLAASQAGDAMASLLVAVAYRERINTADSSVSAADPIFRNYCRYMGLAAAQGWSEVASEHWRLDHCTN
jgi:serine/threonine protein kinase